MIAIAVSLTPSLGARAAPVPNSGVAFFYGTPLPIEALSFYEQVVLEADHVSREQIESLRRGGTSVLAYLSVGEVARTRSWYERVQPDWVLGENAVWQSDIMDLSSPGWRQMLLEQARALAGRGFDGFFLDTLDSYGLVTHGETREIQRTSLASLILSLRAELPNSPLLLNRGFEVLPEVATQVSGVVAESLFRTWNSDDGGFCPVPDADREWLLGQLREIRDRLSLPVIIIDYVSPRQPELALETARLIRKQGFVPWVCTPTLDSMGHGLVTFVPRRVLALYSSAAGPLGAADVHTAIAPCLEYLGFAVDYLDVNGPLPGHSMTQRYAGIISWLQADDVRDRDRYLTWLRRQIDEGVPLAMIGDPGVAVGDDLLALLHLEKTPATLVRPVRLDVDRAVAGFEADPIERSRGYVPIRSQSGQTIISIIDAEGTRVDGVFTAPWGGMALAPFFLRTQLDESRRWTIDPFEFLKRALRLPEIPAPDTTTENGSRLFFAHIDGDGAPSLAEWTNGPFAAEVIRTEILEVYRVPTAVSFVEGEIGPSGLHPDKVEALEDIARKTFALPHVEMATHTYSHPFDWEAATAVPSSSEHRLPIRDYRLDLRREISGSATYLDRLAPEGRRVELVLWSGDALPTASAMLEAEHANLLNMNGGTTQIRRSHPSLFYVSPLLRPVGRHLQVYAPITNENVYTNLWRGPFYGFRHVIESFEMTDNPRRLKPIDIYYHFYSGSKQSSLAALREVYDWALTREILPIFPSEFVRLALAFDGVTVGIDLDGRWWFRGLGDLRTLRVPTSMGWPDIGSSPEVVSVRDHSGCRYVSMAPSSPDSAVTLRFRREALQYPTIERTNARVTSWLRDGCGFTLTLFGHNDIELTIAGIEPDSELTWNGLPAQCESDEDRLTVQLPGGESGEIVLRPR